MHVRIVYRNALSRIQRPALQCHGQYSGRTPSDGVHNPHDGITCVIYTIGIGILYVHIIITIVIILCVLWLPQVNHTSTVFLMADRVYEPVAPLTT